MIPACEPPTVSKAPPPASQARPFSFCRKNSNRSLYRKTLRQRTPLLPRVLRTICQNQAGSLKKNEDSIRATEKRMEAGSHETNNKGNRTIYRQTRGQTVRRGEATEGRLCRTRAIATMIGIKGKTKCSEIIMQE